MTDPDLTRNQRLVLEAISRAGRPVSAYDILEDIRPHGIKSPIQVYRAVKKLIENGAVHKVESLNAFVPCAGRHTHGLRTTILAVCEQCGRVTEFSNDIIDRQIAEWAARERFDIEATSIEVNGRCADCALEHNRG